MLTLFAMLLTPLPVDQAGRDGGSLTPNMVTASPEAATDHIARLIGWVRTSGDNGGKPFIVIDKTAAELYLFDPSGEQVASTAVLLGAAKGDDSAPGIGDLPLSRIPVHLRTTPAGRFLARYGPTDGGRDVLWISFADSVALHPVVTGNSREQRQRRLRSPSPTDNRITFGCINVPKPFYDGALGPLLMKQGAVVYILPETRPLSQVFPIGDGSP